MQYGIVRGSVIASQKVSELQGVALKILQACNDRRESVGDPFVAIDAAVGARTGDLVLWVGKREASLAIPGVTLTNNYPVDAAITGIIDDIS